MQEPCQEYNYLFLFNFSNTITYVFEKCKKNRHISAE